MRSSTQLGDRLDAPAFAGAAVEDVETAQQDLMVIAVDITSGILQSEEFQRAWGVYHRSKRGVDKNPMYQAVQHLDSLKNGGRLKPEEKEALLSFMHGIIGTQVRALDKAITIPKMQKEDSGIPALRKNLGEVMDYLAAKRKTDVAPELEDIDNSHYRDMLTVMHQWTAQKKTRPFHMVKELATEVYEEGTEMLADKWKRLWLAGTSLTTASLGYWMYVKMGASKTYLNPDTAGLMPGDVVDNVVHSKFSPLDLTQGGLSCHDHIAQLTSPEVADFVHNHVTQLPQHCPAIANVDKLANTAMNAVATYKENVFDVGVTNVAHDLMQGVGHITEHMNAEVMAAVAAVGLAIAGGMALRNQSWDLIKESSAEIAKKIIKPTPLKYGFYMAAAGVALVMTQHGQHVSWEQTPFMHSFGKAAEMFANWVYDINMVENGTLHPIFFEVGAAAVIGAAASNQSQRKTAADFTGDWFRRTFHPDGLKNGRGLKYIFAIAGGAAAYHMTQKMNTPVVLATMGGAWAGQTLQKVFTRVTQNKDRVQAMVSDVRSSLVNFSKVAVNDPSASEKFTSDTSAWKQGLAWSGSGALATYATILFQNMNGNVEAIHNEAIRLAITHSSQMAAYGTAAAAILGLFLPYNIAEDNTQHGVFLAAGAILALPIAAAIVAGRGGLKLLPKSELTVLNLREPYAPISQNESPYLEYSIVEEEKKKKVAPDLRPHLTKSGLTILNLSCRELSKARPNFISEQQIFPRPSFD